MEIKDYKAPQAKVIEVKVQGMLCQSGQEFSNTEKFGMSGSSYDEDAWE